MTRHLTQTEAIEEAKAFCRAIGAPVTAPATAVRSDEDQNSSLSPTLWPPCWQIRFGNEAEVAVADSGMICHYRNSAYFSSAQSEQGQLPAGPTISRVAALAKAAIVLTIAHVTETLAPPQSQEENTNAARQGIGPHWMVTRRRQAQGVAFQEQKAIVVLRADTGMVLDLNVTFPTPPPAPVKPKLTQAQAVTAAQAVLTQGDYARTGFGSAKPVGTVRLTWITPQTEAVTPEVNGVANSQPAPIPAHALPARLAWMCFFRDTDGNSAFLPVDVVTGQVIPNGIGFSWAPPLFDRRAPAPSVVTMPAPPPVVVDHPIEAAILPGATVATVPPNVLRYRLSLTDIYAPLTTLASLGFNPADPQLRGNEETDQEIAGKLEQAAQVGKLILVSGPSAVVPEDGVWSLTRTRETVCKDPIYWQPRPVPAQISMKFSVMPKKQADGRIWYKCQLGTEALALGKSWSGNWGGDRGSGGNSWGDAGATTFLGGLDEEEYAWETGTPRHIQVDGVMHILLIRGEPLP